LSKNVATSITGELARRTSLLRQCLSARGNHNERPSGIKSPARQFLGKSLLQALTYEGTDSPFPEALTLLLIFKRVTEKSLVGAARGNIITTSPNGSRKNLDGHLVHETKRRSRPVEPVVARNAPRSGLSRNIL
jgi:hypothetical protein